MMTASNVLLTIGIVCALWGVVSAVAMADALQRRGLKVNWLFLKVLMFKYVGQYRDVTRAETGRVGSWFYSFVGAMNLALFMVIVGLILRAA
jgi:hypothetical protein